MIETIKCPNCGKGLDEHSEEQILFCHAFYELKKESSMLHLNVKPTPMKICPIHRRQLRPNGSCDDCIL